MPEKQSRNEIEGIDPKSYGDFDKFMDRARHYSKYFIPLAGASLLGGCTGVEMGQILAKIPGEPTKTSPLSPDFTKTPTPSPTDVNYELTPTVQNPATQELTLVSPTEVATKMPTLTLTPEPTATFTPEPTVTQTLEPTATMIPTEIATATENSSLEDTICKDCLFPRAIEHQYDVDYNGTIVKFSISIDSGIVNDKENGIKNFRFDLENKPEGDKLFAETLLRMHHEGYVRDHLGNNLTFEQYVQLVKNGQGQYTTMGVIDRAGMTFQEGKNYQQVVVDPSKRINFVISNKLNPLLVSDYASSWTSYNNKTDEITMRISSPYISDLYSAKRDKIFEKFWGWSIVSSIFYNGMAVLVSDELVLNPNNDKKINRTMFAGEEMLMITDRVCSLTDDNDFPIITPEVWE